MNDMEKKTDQETVLLQYWRVLVRQRLLIAGILGTAVVLSISVSLYLPKKYSSTTSLLPPQQEGSTGLSPLSGMVPMGSLFGGRSQAVLWLGILKSNRIKDAIIERFNLMKVYKKGTLQDARSALSRNVIIWKKRGQEIISITVEDESPEKAAEMANAYAEELDEVNKSMVMSAGRRTKVFVEKRRTEVMVKLTKAENNLRKFQERNKAIVFDDQSKTIFGTIGKLKEELVAKEVELQTLLSYAPPSNPQAEILKAEIKELHESLYKMEEGKSSPGQKNIFIPTRKIPDLALRYARLLREEKTQQTLYELLTQQYELARIQEAKDSPTVQVLDIAKVPKRKVKPRRTVIVFLSTVTAVFYAVFMAFFVEYGYMDQLRKALKIWKDGG